MADPECMGDKQKHPLVPLRLRGTGGTHAGPAGAELAPALSSKVPGAIWPSSCPAWCTMAPHHSHPAAGLGAVGCAPPGWGEGRDVVRPSTTQDGGCGDINHHEPAWGGCLAAGAHHCTAALRGVEGSPWLWASSLGGQPWPRVPCPAGWVAMAELPLGTWSRDSAQGGKEKRHAMRLSSLTNAGTESSVFIGFTLNGLYKEQADSAAHADARTHRCRLPQQLSRHPRSIAQPRRAGLYQTPSANAAVLPARLCLHPCCRWDPGLRPCQHPQQSPARVCAGTDIPRQCGRRTRRSPSLRGEQHSPNICSAVTTETSLSSRPAVNRTFPFLSLLYIAVIPLN